MLFRSTTPFDAMEKAIQAAYQKITPLDERPLFKMIHEYPLSGTPPMMTHIFEDKKGNRIIACKGAIESILENSKLNEVDKVKIQEKVSVFANQGLRVLGVAKVDMAKAPKEFPELQQEFSFEFLGLVGF